MVIEYDSESYTRNNGELNAFIVKGRYDWNLLYYFLIGILSFTRLKKNIVFASLSLTLSKIYAARKILKLNKSMSDDFFIF